MLLNNPTQLALTLLVLTVTSLTARSEFTLTLLHTNDLHSHYAPFDEYGIQCSASRLAQGTCYGGAARLKATVDTLREKYPNVVLCDAGDQSQESLLFSVYRYNITSLIVNMLPYDVMCIGNDEFGLGEDDVIRFSKAVTCPLISANLIHSEVQGARITRSTILKVNDERIGFIGYTTTDTNFRASPGRFRFSDEVEAVRREVAVLRAQNVTKIIALGHAGIEKDKEIAKHVEGIDVVVGGHSHTFLYNGPPPNIETAAGPYPVLIIQPSGRKVPVVQAYRFAKYLGLLTLRFDDNGEVVKWAGNPILLNSSYPEDERVAGELSQWMRPLAEIPKEIVGHTHVLLDHSTCRYAECNIGNTVTDAFIKHFNKTPPPGAWANVAIAITNGGSIRSSLPPGNITLGSILNAQPFGNNIEVFSLRGFHLQEIIEFSIRTSRNKGGFLQFSGLRVEYEYNAAAPNTSKALSINVRCAACLVPTYSPLQMGQVYNVATRDWIAAGGDGYTHFEKYGKHITTSEEIDSEILVAYVRANSPISQGLDMRLVTREMTTLPRSPSTTPGSSSPLPCRSSCPPITRCPTLGLLVVLYATYILILQ